MLKFCEECHEMVEYSITKENMIKNIKGKNIVYTGKTANCNICGSEIFVSEIRDYNLKMLDYAFSRA